MALSLQIDMAAQKDRRSVGSQAIDGYGIAGFVDDTEGQRPGARKFVKRLGNRHDCAGVDCTHPNHVDDVAATNLALILAGLAPDPYPSVKRPREVSPTVERPVKEGGRAHLDRIKARLAAGPQVDHSWQDDALCRDEDSVLFFGPDGERQAERDIREEEAKRVCSGCPVRAECLDGAIARGEKYGIYGGLNPDQRTSERRRRARRANVA